MRAYSLQLQLRTPWKIAHGTSSTRTNVFLDLDDGYGEAPVVPHYPYDEATLIEWLRAALGHVAPDPSVPPAEVLSAVPPGPPPAMSALDMALHDRHARALSRPLHSLLGAPGPTLPRSSISIGMFDDDEGLRAALEQVRGWPLVKLKVGAGDLGRDLEVVRTAREITGAEIFVDANGAWSPEAAARAAPQLAALGVIIMEEPISARDPASWQRLRTSLPADSPLIFADESAGSLAEIERLAPFIDGVNVKLAKAGGISAARNLIERAHNRHLEVLLGCMVESSLGVTAAAHLAHLVEYADLDGFLLVANDPFEGVHLENGILRLPDAPGLGVRLRTSN